MGGKAIAVACVQRGFDLPSTPIAPSPSLSPAFRKALVSASVRALAPALKTWRKSLQKIQNKGLRLIPYGLYKRENAALCLNAEWHANFLV